MANLSLAIKPIVEIFDDEDGHDYQEEQEAHKVVPLNQPEEHKYIYVLVRSVFE